VHAFGDAGGFAEAREMSAAHQDLAGGRQGAVQAAEAGRAGALVPLGREPVRPPGGQGREGLKQEKESNIRSSHPRNLSR
jgi:hypothetical protein